MRSIWQILKRNDNIGYLAAGSLCIFTLLLILIILKM